MINHIVHYQNNFSTSFLFKKNFMKLMQMGIRVTNLLDSDVFRFPLKFDEWPTVYPGEEIYKPYNGSIFELRDRYLEVFGEIPTDVANVQKVKYFINILPMVGMYIENSKIINPSLSLMQSLGSTEELDIFSSDAIRDIIQYKWTTYG